MSIIEDADGVQGKEPRLREFRTKDGRNFVGKGTLCTKRKGEHNPTWLANEVIYTAFARACNLRVPATAIFRHGGEFYFGSEKLIGRVPLEKHMSLDSLFDDRNRKQLTRSALLDLALLNSDRTAGNILIDDGGLLWFYDHDKSLCGDGVPQVGRGGKAGDLGRLQPSEVIPSFNNFLGDYLFLRFPEANELVFSKQDWTCIQTEFRQLTLDPELLANARATIPDSSWLSDDLYAVLKQFLLAWWDRLRIYFAEHHESSHLLGVLRRRQEERKQRAEAKRQRH